MYHGIFRLQTQVTKTVFSGYKPKFSGYKLWLQKFETMKSVYFYGYKEDLTRLFSLKRYRLCPSGELSGELFTVKTAPNLPKNRFTLSCLPEPIRNKTHEKHLTTLSKKEKI
jgi:hypothetical protein